MNIKIVSHLFNKFIPLDCKSLFLDVQTTEDKVKDIMNEIYSDQMQLLSMVMYGKLKAENEENETREEEMKKENEKINEKYLRSVRYRNRRMYDEMLTYRNGLTKDTMKMVADKWLRRKEKEIKRRSLIREWKVLAAEIVRKVPYEEEFDEFSWEVYRIKKLIMPLIKLLHKTLSHIIINAWLYTEENIRLSLKTTTHKKKYFVHLSCPKGELFENCKIFIKKFLENYII